MTETARLQIRPEQPADLDAVLDGDLGAVIDSAVAADEAARLAAVGE